MTYSSRFLLFIGALICLLRDQYCCAQSCFQTKQELMDAIDAYIQDPSSSSSVAAQYGPIGSWCVSRITDFSALFAYKQNFVADSLDGWDTSSVTTMERMFERCNNFRGKISSWDVSKVGSFRSMFQQATRFDGDLSGWITSSATDMSFMFYDATSFSSDLSQWRVSKVVNFESFASAATSLNPDLSGWDIRACTNFKNMFARGSGLSKSLCAWGSKINWSASIHNMFGVSDTTSSRCPEPWDPTPDKTPPGPFCHSCDPNANPDGTAPGSQSSNNGGTSSSSNNGGGGGGQVFATTESSASCDTLPTYLWCCITISVMLLSLWI